MSDQKASGFDSFAAWRTAATRPNEGPASSSSKAQLNSSKESSSPEPASIPTGIKTESSTSIPSSPPNIKTPSRTERSEASSPPTSSSSNPSTIANVDLHPTPPATSSVPSAFKSRRRSPPTDPEPVVQTQPSVSIPSFLSETPKPEPSTPTKPTAETKPAGSPPFPFLSKSEAASSTDIASKTHPSYLPITSTPPTSLVTNFFLKFFGSGSTTKKPEDTPSAPLSSLTAARSKPVWTKPHAEPPSFLSADPTPPTSSSSTTPTSSSSPADASSSASPPSSSSSPSSFTDILSSLPPPKQPSSKPKKQKSSPIYPPLSSPSEVTNLKAQPPPSSPKKKKKKNAGELTSSIFADKYLFPSGTIIPSPLSRRARRAELLASSSTTFPKSKSKTTTSSSSPLSTKSKSLRFAPPSQFLTAPRAITSPGDGVRRVPRPNFEPSALPRLKGKVGVKGGGGGEEGMGLIRPGFVGERAEKAAERRKEMAERKLKREVEVRKVDGKEAPPHQYSGGSADMWDVILDTRIKGKKPISLEPAADRPPVAQLAHSLDRVLFNPGIHFLRDPRSNVYNFDARIRDLPHPDEFDQKRFPPYVTASKDLDLRELAKAEKCTFYGSTSTLTSCLSQIYFMIGRWRELNTTMLSAEYAEKPTSYTFGAKLPASIFLKYNEDGTYAVDNDKTFETAGDPRILSELGKVMEKLLTTSSKDLARFRKDAPEEAVSEEERNAREAYHYTKGSSILMRSQLDGVDPRLPGTGSFDIKTRSTIAIRMDMENIEEGRHYPLRFLTGVHESFEKERWDMFRSAFLKYSLQCRIGGMDGIFCAYHSTSVMHGFQYIPVDEMDEVLFGSTTMGDQNFALSVEILEKVFEEAKRLYPGVNLEVTMKTPDNVRGEMAVFVQPQEWDEASAGTAKPIVELRVQGESRVEGAKIVGEIEVKEGQKWHVDLSITRDPLFESPKAQRDARRAFDLLRMMQIDIGSTVKCPSGITEAQMQKIFDDRWYAEVSDPDSGFSHLAVREVKAWEEEDEDEEDVAAEEGVQKRGQESWRIGKAKAGNVRMVKAKPPRLSFGKVQQDVLAVRQLAREAKAREEELRKKLRGKEVHHWVQGPLFADLEEEEVEEVVVVEETKEEEK